MTDAWEMHPETGLNPGPVWRDRGVIIANLTARNQALKERVAELELAALNLRDNTQGAHEALGKAQAEAERLRAVLADYENRITWDTTCGQCARTLDHAIRDYNRADAAEAREAALRAHIEALADEWDEVLDGPLAEHAIPRDVVTDLRAALAASAAEDTTPEPTPAEEDDEPDCPMTDDGKHRDLRIDPDWNEVICSACHEVVDTPAAEPPQAEDTTPTEQQAQGGAMTVQNAPLGTFAPSSIGGGWTRVERGWRWGVSGSTFPRPGGDWTGRLIAPAPVADPSGDTP